MKTVRRNLKDLRYYRAIKKITRFLDENLYLITAALASLIFLFDAADTWNVAFSDADGYMRAIRIHHLLINPSFYEQVITESNYPFGEVLHWTRPFDVIWIANLLPFIGFLAEKDAVFMAGAMSSPWLGLITAVALVYGLRRQFNSYISLFGLIIFLLNPITQNYFSYHRADHQSLVILLSVYALSTVMCWLKKRHLRYLRLLGGCLALMTFTAIEGIIIYVLFLAFFLYLYVYKNLALTPIVKTSKYYAIALTVFWFLNPPYEGWFYPDNGRISILYVTLSWLMFICLYGLNLSKLHTKTLKLYSLVCASLGTALALLLIFGTNIYHFQLTDEINLIWSNRIKEMHAIWQNNIAENISIYPFSFVALCLAVILLKYKPYRRLMILELCLGLPLFILTIMANRFSYYQTLYSVIPYLALVNIMYKKSAFAHRKSEEFPGSIWGLIFGTLLFQQLLFIPYSLWIENTTQPKKYTSALCRQIEKIGGTLVTDTFLSPEFIWHCGVNTVGTPYHRNQEGIIDNHNILTAEDDNTLIPMLLKHQVTQILLFEKYDNRYYDMAAENNKKLYYRLIKRKNIPYYLEEVPTTNDNARLYQLKL